MISGSDPRVGPNPSGTDQRLQSLVIAAFIAVALMTDTSWKEVLLQSLEQRDEREQLCSDIYEACTFF